MSRAVEPNTTLFAILGLLAIRPFTTYELERQFDRSLRRFWPRVRSKVYEGPKRLVDLGFAKATPGKTGKRRHTTYSITAKGRRALAVWLAEPGAPPQIEFEGLLKLFFAEHATKADVIASLRATQAAAREDIDLHIETGRTFMAGASPFQQRVAHVLVAGRFISEFSIFVEQWATWALGVVEAWPDDPAAATPDVEALAANVELLERARATWD